MHKNNAFGAITEFTGDKNNSDKGEKFFLNKKRKQRKKDKEDKEM